MIFARRRRTSPADSEHKLLTVYELVWLRTLDKDVLQWQAPALALTAESFLMTITLGSGTPRLARGVASLLGVVVSVIAMQLMAKHQWLLRRDMAQLAIMERELGLPGQLLNYGWPRGAGPRSDRHTRVGEPKYLRSTFWRRGRSFVWWQVALAVFGIVSAACLAASLVAPHLFETP